MTSPSYFPLVLSLPPPSFDGVHSRRCRHLVPFLRSCLLPVDADASSSRLPRFVLYAARSRPPPPPPSPPPPPPRLSSNARSFFASFGRRALLFTTLVPYTVPVQDVVAVVNLDEESVIQDSVRKILSKAKAAGMLRLAFHDAGTFNLDDNSGGMNGSIVYELDRPENAGLGKSIKILEKAKMEIDNIQPVSWADLMAVAGAEAVSFCGGPVISIALGRLDVRVPDPPDRLPQETMDASNLKNCFQKKGFSTQELVALSGAHTLGSKGFGNPYVFDNTYFRILLEKPWTSSDGMSSMIGLPSDRALVEDEECLRWIKIYSDDQVKFFKDFINAYIKLVNTGASWKGV